MARAFDSGHTADSNPGNSRAGRPVSSRLRVLAEQSGDTCSSKANGRERRTRNGQGQGQCEGAGGGWVS
eukprot:scaffold102008_cov69-Phaeocystis_antarctica.AAC.1